MLRPSASGTRPTYVYLTAVLCNSLLTSCLLGQYAQPVTKRGAKKDAAAETTEEKKLSNHAQRKYDERKKGEFLREPQWG